MQCKRFFFYYRQVKKQQNTTQNVWTDHNLLTNDFNKVTMLIKRLRPSIKYLWATGDMLNKTAEECRHVSHG